MRTKSGVISPLLRIVVAITLSAAAGAVALWAYERYQTQQLLNNNVARAADDYADAMRNLNDQLERFERQR